MRKQSNRAPQGRLRVTPAPAWTRLVSGFKRFMVASFSEMRQECKKPFEKNTNIAGIEEVAPFLTMLEL